jgi:hypothetical protein
MAAKAKQDKYTLEIEAPANGRVHKATVTVRDREGNTRAQDTGDLASAAERRRVARELARQLGDENVKKWQDALDKEWAGMVDRQQRLREQMEAGSPEAAPRETVQLLDAAPQSVRRPLCLIGGRSYAAAWVPVQNTVSQSVGKDGVPVKHDPPLVTVTDVLLIVAGDGTLHADAALNVARPLRELGLLVRLPSPLPPGREWSGAGVKRYLAGERPGPAEVFGRVVSVVDRFIDFARSLAPQQTMCEMVACYVFATYLLDALNVVGYLWPNGEHGCGKTSFLQVVAEMAYLGQVILASSSCPCLRDLADYGATLAFDDAEAVMDTRRTDPDKRTLLLAGNRRGATIAVKESLGDAWQTRHVNTFCPRLFSAIRLPDEVLGSRSIVVPLVRSGDPRRAKANPMDEADWPTDRRRLVDDLWAVGLAHLPEIPKYDRLAAELAELSGRNLDPWRGILAVAGWLEEKHGVSGLYDRMEKLSREYQKERDQNIEESDRTRVLFRALLKLSVGRGEGDQEILPKQIADAMNEIAAEEDLAEPDKPFTTPKKVGWLLKRQRFRRPTDRNEKGKPWLMSRAEIVSAAKAYGVETDAKTQAETAT